jgi:hypothetical protein
MLVGGFGGLVLMLTAIFYSGGNDPGPDEPPVVENGGGETNAGDDQNATAKESANDMPTKQSRSITDRTVLQFNGSSSYAVASSLNPEAGANYTIEARIRPQSIRSAQPSNVVSWLGPDWMAIFIGQNGTVGLARRTDETSFVYSSTQVIQPGQWYHVAASFDSATMRLFVNGRETELSRQPFELPETEGGFFIGGVDRQRLPSSQNDRFFHGQVESVRITSGARYLANFVPSPQLTSDENTLAVFPLHRLVNESAAAPKDLSKRHSLQLHDTDWAPVSFP